MTLTRIGVCADDYAFTPGVSRGIRELAEIDAISATSVMTVAEFWPEEAPRLKAVAGRTEVGLHLTLTDQRPLGPMPSFAPQGRFPPMKEVLAAGLRGRLPLAEIETEAERQIARFIEHYGAPPAYIDGHHHTQQLPGVRDIVIRAARRLGQGRVWVRNGYERPARIAARGIAPFKALAIGLIGRGMRQRARSAGVPTNDGFSGAYDFLAERRSMADLFHRFVDGARAGHLVFCHPGYSDEILAARDVMTKAREAELAFLKSPDWPALLAARGLEIGPLVA